MKRKKSMPYDIVVQVPGDIQSKIFFEFLNVFGKTPFLTHDNKFYVQYLYACRLVSKKWKNIVDVAIYEATNLFEKFFELPEVIYVQHTDSNVDCRGRFRRVKFVLRNDAPFYNRDGQGCIYFDGKFWKICQIGNGGIENGWNFSQQGSVTKMLMGEWKTDKRNQNEVDRNYNGLFVVKTLRDAPPPLYRL